MKRKPTPAQIAARERFAEMARSGAFKRSKTRKAKPKQSSDKNAMISQMILERVESGESVKSAYDAVLGKGAYDRLAGELYSEIRKTKSNPAKKTVSQKISQLTREGYPQKQAVAIALNEERKGKVKRNPSDYRFEIRRANKAQTLDSVYATLAQAKNALDEIDRPPASFFLVDTQTGKHYFSFQAETKLPMVELRATAMQKAYKRNPRASNPIVLVTDSKPSKRKSNPQTRRKNPMARKSNGPFYYALVPDDGGFSFGMDSRTPVQFVFSNRDRTRGIYRSFALPNSVTSNPEFQQFASSLPGNSIVASLDQLRNMLRKYA